LVEARPELCVGVQLFPAMTDDYTMRRTRRLAAAILVVAAGAAADPGRPADALADLLATHRVAAHRGGYGMPDSNTVARFELARQQGADIVETDLRVSKDGVVFLFHNALLDKVTNCTGPFAKRTAAELAHCHLRGLERGPDRFEDALRWSEGRVVVDAELKAADATEPAIDLVRRYGAYDWVYFQVGNGLDTYRRVRRYDARVALEAAPHGPRGEQWLAELLAKRDPRLLLIQLHPDFLSERVREAVRAAGKRTSINAWTLAPETAAASCTDVFARGIDVAVTNAPKSCAGQRDQAIASSSAAAPSRAPTR
jgi:glycerophosphoryl diester phosphodiesterase